MNLKTAKNFSDSDCGCLTCRSEYNGVTVCIHFVTSIIIIVFVLFVTIFRDRFLLAMSYFNLPTLNKVINEINK